MNAEGATCGKGFITPMVRRQEGGGGGGGDGDGEKDGDGCFEGVDGGRQLVSLTTVEDLPTIARYMPRFALSYLLGSYAPKLFLGMVLMFKRHRKIE